LQGDYLKLIDDQGREFSADTSASFYLKDGTAIYFETVNPGIVKHGQVVFDVPKNLKVMNVRISNSYESDSFYDVKLLT